MMMNVQGCFLENMSHQISIGGGLGQLDGDAVWGLEIGDGAAGQEIVGLHTEN